MIVQGRCSVCHGIVVYSFRNRQSPVPLIHALEDIF
jgi:hypothetical protein